MTPRSRVRLLLVALTLALGGCTLLSFVYGRLDTVAEVWADRWFDFDREQSQRFKVRVRERLAENRRVELPLFSDYLDGAVRLVEGRPTPGEIDAFLERGRGLFEQALRRSLPLMSETLAGLSPAQVEHFARELDESNEEFREDELDGDAAERQAERRKELLREVERWTGKLEPAQRAILERLVAQVPDGARAWYDYRRVRQRGLLALLRARAPASGHAEYIESWWLGDRHLEPDYAAQLARNREVTVVALAELVATLTPRQRERAAARLRSIARELDELHAQGRDKE
jgi:hypothetical protein